MGSHALQQRQEDDRPSSSNSTGCACEEDARNTTTLWCRDCFSMVFRFNGYIKASRNGSPADGNPASHHDPASSFQEYQDGLFCLILPYSDPDKCHGSFHLRLPAESLVPGSASNLEVVCTSSSCRSQAEGSQQFPIKLCGEDRNRSELLKRKVTHATKGLSMSSMYMGCTGTPTTTLRYATTI